MHILLRGLYNTPGLTCVNGLFGRAIRSTSASLDLNKDKNLTFTDYKVKLSETPVKVTLDNAVTLFFKILLGELLAVPAKPGLFTRRLCAARRACLLAKEPFKHLPRPLSSP